MPGIDIFRDMLNRSAGERVRDAEDRLVGGRPEPVAEYHPQERVLLIRLDGTYYIETVENAALAASADPDFVAAIPVSRLRPLINRSVN